MLGVNTVNTVNTNTAVDFWSPSTCPNVGAAISRYTGTWDLDRTSPRETGWQGGNSNPLWVFRVSATLKAIQNELQKKYPGGENENLIEQTFLTLEDIIAKIAGSPGGDKIIGNFFRGRTVVEQLTLKANLDTIEDITEHLRGVVPGFNCSPFSQNSWPYWVKTIGNAFLFVMAAAIAPAENNIRNPHG